MERSVGGGDSFGKIVKRLYYIHQIFLFILSFISLGDHLFHSVLLHTMNLRHLRLLTNLTHRTSHLTTPLSSLPIPLPIPTITPSPPNLPHFHLFHSTPLSLSSTSAEYPEPEEESEQDAAMNEFLSRFVHSMRTHLNSSYPHCDKPTIDSMLLVIVDKLISQMDSDHVPVTDELGNEDLTKTMWEVSNRVFEEMEREKKKEKMKKYLQSEQVKELARFASQVGVRGEMLRELRFKWAREVMEEAEFYEELKKSKAHLEEEAESVNDGQIGGADVEEGGEKGVRELPKRKGRMKYKLYGLDLSGEKWRGVAEKICEAEEVAFLKEGKEITGKCKVVTERIVGLGKEVEEEEVRGLVKEWVELLQPSRVDWVGLLERLKGKDWNVYLKMAERILDEPSFEADIRDYSILIDAHAKENRVEDIERLLKGMSEKGIKPDVITLTCLLHMYSKSNNLEQAKETYEALESQGFKPDLQIYKSLIMANINAGQPKSAEELLREMELRDFTSPDDIHVALLRAYAKSGDRDGAQRIVTTMEFAGFQPTPESCTLLIEACAKSGNQVDAKNNFEKMMRLGFKPDDKSTALVLSAYEKKNELDNALSLLLQLEKEGFEPGVSTYNVLIDWLGKLQLVDEAEQMLSKMAQLGEVPSLKIQVSLCDMYARAVIEKKALQALGVLEAKLETLERDDFERIIQGLLKGGFVNDARRIQKLMEDQGFAPSESLNISLMATQAFGVGGSGKRTGMR